MKDPTTALLDGVVVAVPGRVLVPAPVCVMMMVVAAAVTTATTATKYR